MALVVAGVAGGCLIDQRREMREAREAYDACVAEHPHDAERACEVERAELDTRSERYETNAQRAWGCNAGTTGCDPRDPAPSPR